MQSEIQSIREKIENSEGMKCIAKMNYHNRCIGILNGNCKDLAEKLSIGENFAEAMSYGLMDQKNASLTAEYLEEIIRYLHNFLASASMLIDITRNLIKTYSNTKIYKKYQEKINLDFINDELSNFIGRFRNYILHCGVPSAGMRIDVSANTTVFLSRDEMLKWSGWNAKSKKYLNSCPEEIRITEFARLYTKKVDNLNQWINREIKEYHAKDLAELYKLQEQLREN
ncbi:MAG: hypothetical protein M0Z56_02000 [Desulfobacteraceae bacterium]|nr:hypothetical protein [Desulfobacteraceae bacterium]